MFLRYKMYKIMQLLMDKKIISGKAAEPLDKTALYALKSVGAVNIEFGNNEIDAVALGDKGALYVLMRHDLWMSRFGAFIVGISSGVIIQWMVSLVA